MPDREEILSSFAQIHVRLYVWGPHSVKTIAGDLRLLIPSLSVNVETLKDALAGLRVVDSRFIGERGDEFVYAHRINDIVAIRYVRNESVPATDWGKWQGLFGKEKTRRRSTYFGHATLLQCEGDPNKEKDDLLRSALAQALRNSSDYSSLSLGHGTSLPFGHLFELDPAQIVWLLVNRSNEERAARWMDVHWLRLIVFIKKHNHYVRLFRQEMKKLDKEITRIVLMKDNLRFNTTHASKVFGEWLRTCETILDNLGAAEIGYRNSLGDTLGVRSISERSKRKDFLFRMREQMRLTTRVFQRQLETIKRRWSATRIESKKVSSERTRNEVCPAIRLFCSYSHKDARQRKQLETHLKVLQRRNLIGAWDDRNIDIGDPWEEKINENLERADIILLLLSANFFASDYCYEKEMTRALERHTRGEIRLIPVIVRDCNWRNTVLGKLEALPEDGRAVDQWRPRSSAWRNISEGIEKMVDQIYKGRLDGG